MLVLVRCLLPGWWWVLVVLVVLEVLEVLEVLLLLLVLLRKVLRWEGRWVWVVLRWGRIWWGSGGVVFVLLVWDC